MHNDSPTRFVKLYYILAVFGALLIICGIVADGAGVLQGLRNIVTCSSLLISDYVAVGGLGGALVNSGLCTLIAVAVLYFSRDPANGATVANAGLIAGFSLFGKNIFNIWPILIGSWLYSRIRKKHYGSYSAMGLLATTLAPAVSYIAQQGKGIWWHNLAFALLIGAVIGFLLPPLAEYTFKILNGMNLFNMGFAAGLLGMILIPLLIAMGYEPLPELQWTSGIDPFFVGMLTLLSTSLIAAGIIIGKKQSLRDYAVLLSTSGRAPSDYLRMFGTAPMLINMGVNGIISTALLIVAGGDLNGATAGGILVIIGFSAYGCHAFNMLPVMVGVMVGEMLMHISFSDPAAQLALLFSTTLAPVSGTFGSAFGGIAGLVHLAVVMRSGLAAQGANLYNNGFAGGIVAIVLYPILTSIIFRHKPLFRLVEYTDTFENTEDIPIPEDEV